MHFVKYIPLLSVMVFDLAFTLIGQPDAYWEDYDRCDEANQIGKTVLSLGPEYFVLLFILYSASLMCLVKRLPKIFGIAIAAIAFLGHAWGSASWLPTLFSNLFFLEIEKGPLYAAYFIGIATISGLCFWNRYHSKPSTLSA